jgi:hypothetical protein
VDRDEFLDAAARAWGALDLDDYPFSRAVAGQLRGHDDREQFLAGIDLVLTGITTVHGLPTQPAGSRAPRGRSSSTESAFDDPSDDRPGG